MGIIINVGLAAEPDHNPVGLVMRVLCYIPSLCTYKPSQHKFSKFIIIIRRVSIRTARSVQNSGRSIRHVY